MSTEKKHKEPAHSEPTTGAAAHHGHDDAHKEPTKDDHAKPVAQAAGGSLNNALEVDFEGI